MLKLFFKIRCLLLQMKGNASVLGSDILRDDK